MIYYPEGRQELIELDGQAHNVEVNKETGLIWVTINPPHGHGHDDEDNGGHSHNDDETNNHSHNNDEEDNHGHNNNNDEENKHRHGSEHDEGTGEIVAAYDIFTLEKVEEYAAGSHPAHVSITKDGNTVVFSNSGDNTVTIIDRATEEAAVIETGEYPHGLRISPDQKYAYVANMHSGDVSIIDLGEKTEVNRVPAGEGAVQTGFSHDGKYAFAGLHLADGLAVIDTESQELVKTIEVGVGPVQMYASYDNEYVIVANQGSADSPSNTISIISLDEVEVVKELQVGEGAHGIVISEDSRYAFVTNMFEDTISVVDLETLEETERIDTGKYPNGISVY
ncbi:YncE family protein [Evansella sp. LMS18]|uniref:YncE family protein n=1 Tax=Evansella sp. LMS18 TaxID=2924033 RepID=UPI0020D1DF4F|nr:YncE family protein [Evansella sp. LMS18]UTR12932.1 YncE family protein [Evansella sp. LMS18]